MNNLQRTKGRSRDKLHAPVSFAESQTPQPVDTRSDILATCLTGIVVADEVGIRGGGDDGSLGRGDMRGADTLGTLGADTLGILGADTLGILGADTLGMRGAAAGNRPTEGNRMARPPMARTD